MKLNTKFDKNLLKTVLQYFGGFTLALISAYLVSDKAKEGIDQGAETAHTKTQGVLAKIKDFFNK